jgi:tetratricopeptide (TPR) repeat protein
MYTSYRIPHRLSVATIIVLIVAATGLRAQTAMLTADEQATIITRISELLNERYVFPDVAVKTGEHLLTELKKGSFKADTDPVAFATHLTQEAQSITHDKHMRVRAQIDDGMGGGKPDPLADRARMMKAMHEGNYGFKRVELLDGNIGYLDLRSFTQEAIARPTAIAAMRFLENADALIIDLRKNGGGDPRMVQLLCSYFFDRRTHLNSLYWRQGDRTEEFWTFDSLPGHRMADVPLYILTSDYTFSGAEEFTYDMQTRNRATIIGQTTGGGANPGGVVPINERFGIFIPTGRAINPVTKTNWEGVGVKPDVAVSAELALDTAVALARKAADTRREMIAAKEKEVRSTITHGLAEAEKLLNEKKDATDAVRTAMASGRSAGMLDEDAINMLGYNYMMRDQLQLATAIFSYNVEAYPASWNVYDSLGEAYMKQGDRKRAIELYQKSLALNPGNENGKMMLREMGVEL